MKFIKKAINYIWLMIVCAGLQLPFWTVIDYLHRFQYAEYPHKYYMGLACELIIISIIINQVIKFESYFKIYKL